MLESPLTCLKGTGPRRAEYFGRLGLCSVRALLYNLPRVYKDYSRPKAAADCMQGEDVLLRLRVEGEAKLARISRALSVVSVQARDESGPIRLVWYNQSYRKGCVAPGDTVYAAGRVDTKRGRKLVNPMLSAQPPGILPVYALVKGLNQRVVRETVRAALAMTRGAIEESIPDVLLARYKLPGLARALEDIHFPGDTEALHAARRRLAFEDLLLYTLMAEELRRGRENAAGIAFPPVDRAAFLSHFPFAPTAAQRRVMEEIAADMASVRPMNRLLQGDVGSGKTLAALFAMHTAAENGCQAALLAPTEVLARQHFQSVQALFGEDAVLLLGGMKKSEKEKACARVSSGTAKAVVGTHALLQEGVNFDRLGLVVADEQHRFGVQQRAFLKNRGCPDMLIMSATPIPRTLALLFYGDLDISLLDEMPPGRKAVTTRYVPPEKRAAMYAFIEAEIRQGRQAYAVCPLVEPSEEMEELQSAQGLYAELRGKMDVRVGLLHGQMKSADKQAAIEAFYRGETQLLVSTTVIEVGVDVPNASVMAIENAERFGLAQLHQLRGRVGRGAAASYCFLLGDREGEGARARLSTLTQTQDGFAIAQKDLQMRGPGELLGLRQHGAAALGALSLTPDMELLHAARETAQALREDAALQGQCEAILKRAREMLEQKRIAMN